MPEKRIPFAARLPEPTYNAIKRKARRLGTTQTELLVSIVNEALGLTTTAAPIHTTEDDTTAAIEQRLAGIEERLVALENRPNPTSTPTAPPVLLTKEESVKLAIERGLEPDSKNVKTPASKRFGNKYIDYANGKTSTNPEELWQLRRVKVSDREYKFIDLLA